MTLSEFIDAIRDAGWLSNNDAQWDNITKLYHKWFPQDKQVLDELQAENVVVLFAGVLACRILGLGQDERGVESPADE